MLKRYIGPYDQVSVAVAGNDFGTVKNGEALVVPDVLAESVEWAPENWEDVKSTKKARKEAKEPVSGDLAPNDSDVNEPGAADENVSDSNTDKTGMNENIADNSGNKEGN